MTSRLPAAILVAATLAVGLWLWPFDSDGAIGYFDGALNGVEAEQDARGSIHGSHPLSHVIILGLEASLEACGVRAPGHVAARIFSAIGAALVVVLVVRAAGRSRLLAGTAFAAALVSTREFVVGAAVGDTILPACAAALWSIDEATRSAVRTTRVWSGIVIACLLREDSILFVPGLVAALWATLEPGQRGRIAAGLAASGAATLLGYGICWLYATRGSWSFWHWLVAPALVGTWGSGGVDPTRFTTYVDSLSAGVVGRWWPRSEPKLWIAATFAGATIVASALLRGSGRWRAAAMAVTLTIVLRAAFFAWWSPVTPKWSAPTLALLCYLGARLARGAPRHPLRIRAVGGAMLALLMTAVLLAHGPTTVRLRERHFIEKITHAVSEGRGSRFIAHGPNVGLALRILGVPHVAIMDWPDVGRSLDEIAAELRAHPVPTMVIVDRWMLSTDPYTSAIGRRHPLFIDALDRPGLRPIRSDGLVYAVAVDPGALR